MHRYIALVIAAIVVAGCEVSIPNGVFGCGQSQDCPGDFFCWSSDNRCYDAPEPGCVQQSCEQAIQALSAADIEAECGTLPDGCDGTIDCRDCPNGTVCGANGQNLLCGCEENTCVTFGGGAQCGEIPTRCADDAREIFCGDCLGLEICEGNRCVCPAGVDCDGACGGCAAGEVCVDGECCVPAFPCTDNECSPPGGLPDGCGGLAQCPPCSIGEECVLGSDSRYACLGDCTCEAQGIECGPATICGANTLCGTCEENGFDAPSCVGGRCVCKDMYEGNRKLSSAALVCSDNCLQDTWGLGLVATLHDAGDFDFYKLEVLDSTTPVVLEVLDGESDYNLGLSYLCPDGSVGIEECSGAVGTIEAVRFCLETGQRTVSVTRSCPGGASSTSGTVYVAVWASSFRGVCDQYDFTVYASAGVPVL